MLQGILQEALEHGQFWRLRDSAGKPPGVIGWWPACAVTFIDNHDTGMSIHAGTCQYLYLQPSCPTGCIPAGSL